MAFAVLPRRCRLALFLCAPALLVAQSSPELGQILERLQRLEEQNRALAAEVRALREQLASARDSTADAAQGGATPALEERLAVQESRTAEQAQAKVEASQRFPIRVTGMALFNAFLNSSGSGGSQYPTVAVSGSGRSGGATVRQTTLGIAYSGPRTLWNGAVNGSVEMDFWGGSGGALDQGFRLRVARIGIDWKTRSLRFGVDKPLIAQRDPNSLAQVAFSPLTGAGNLWLWIPQARFEQTLRLGEHSGVRAQLAAVQTREIRGDAPGPAGQPPAYAGEVAAARPGVQTRIELFSGADRRIEIAPGLHHSVSQVGPFPVPSRVYTVDWLFRPWTPVEFTGTFFSGRNVSHLGTGAIRQGFVVFADRVAPVHSRGGWGQVQFKATPRLSFNLFSGQHDDRNSDLLSGRIGKNLAYGANAFYRLAPNVLASFEVSQLRTVYLQSGTVINNHYDLAVAYLF